MCTNQLSLHQFSEWPLHGTQVIKSTSLDDSAILYHRYSCGMTDCTQPMGNRDDGLPAVFSKEFLQG
jgi:hypothetical protein